MADLLIRTGKTGDWFGLRRKGWSWQKRVERAPHGVVLPTRTCRSGRSRAGCSTPTERSTWPRPG